GYPAGLTQSIRRELRQTGKAEPLHTLDGWAFMTMRCDLAPPIDWSQEHIKFTYDMEVVELTTLERYSPGLKGIPPERLVPKSERVPTPEEFKGMSGGPLWTAKKSQKEIVSPETFKLAGIQSTIDQRTMPATLSVVPIAKWMEYARSFYPDLASEPESAPFTPLRSGTGEVM
ncbi:MAG: hypothetical protein ACREKE_09475, partial [bacterium]